MRATPRGRSAGGKAGCNTKRRGSWKELRRFVIAALLATTNTRVSHHQHTRPFWVRLRIDQGTFFDYFDHLGLSTACDDFVSLKRREYYLWRSFSICPDPPMPQAAAVHEISWDMNASDVELNASGRIVDYLDSSVTRADGAEERVRQAYARILHEEYGYSKDRMVFGAAINIGRQVRYADIVVYSNAAAAHSRDQGRVVLVVETKAPDLVEGRGQLTSYVLASAAQGGIWTNGTEVSYFRRVSSELRVWTNVPRAGETWDTVGHYRKDDLRPPRELKRVFRRCHNAIYRSGLDSEDVALDMVRIILAKYQDEQNDGDVCEFRCTPEEFASAEGRARVATRIHILFKQVVTNYPDVFPDGENITIGDDNLAVVVNELQPFRFLADEDTEQVYDVIGTAFEVYVASHLKGARGQYFTNRLVVNMVVEILAPTERDLIFDPACGSGGFLIACLRYVRAGILTTRPRSEARSRAIRSASQHLFGMDIAPKLVRVAKTNLILNGDGHGGVAHANTLRDPANWPDSFALRPGGRFRPTVILTNPPFGASHELRERDPRVLQQFELGHAWESANGGPWLRPTAAVLSSEGVPPEILFLERCIDLLAPGGKLAIVIARGVLDNREALPARQYILRQTRLLGVINCHPNTFAPFNGTKAGIIILEKKRASGIQLDEDYPVFMAVSQKVGQDSQGREIHKTGTNGDLTLVDGHPVIDHDLGLIAEAWRAYSQASRIHYDQAWTVPLSRILAEGEMRFNPVRYAPEAEKALAQVLELGGSGEWVVERLGDFATVFNGPRFKRPFAGDGVTDGLGIVRMYTPKAFFEERGESAKYLNYSGAKPIQDRQREVLTLHRDWILIVDSGTAGKMLGRVGMTTAVHEGAIGNNNLIRVVIEDPVRRDYVYQFLRSELGQTLLLRNVYGTNQDHIEPDDVKDIPIPLPADETRLLRVYEQVRQVTDLREQAASMDAAARAELGTLFERAVAAVAQDN